jgi:CRP/FNR family cyclic AMP-dependent transcriptional regulator
VVSGRAFLHELDPDDRDALTRRLRFHRYTAGQLILRQGEAGNDAVVIREGRVKLVAATSDGREVLLAVRGDGELLGEMAALDGQPRGASAVALEAVDAGHISSSELRAFLAEHPRAALVLMRLLMRRLREADRGRIELSTHDALGRVAARLLELGERYGRPGPRGMQIELPITQEELASWTGASRPAVARALGLMRQLEWIATSRRAIVIHDLEALRLRCSIGEVPRAPAGSG